MTKVELTTADVARAANGTLKGPADLVLVGVASLLEAEPHHISFLGNSKYKRQMKHSRAGAILVPDDYPEEPADGQAYIVCDKPSAAFSEFVVMFAPPEVLPKPGLHPTAIIASGVEVPATTHIGAHVVIEEGAIIGEETIIEAGCYIGQETRIGNACRLYPNVTIRERCLLGDRVVIQSGSVVGSDGFGFELAQAGHNRIPQTGIVQIDNDVDLGACVTVDRARFGRTWIKQGVKIDNLVQIAHNVVVGERTVIVAQVGIAGSTIIGDGVILAGQVGVPGHVEIGNDSVIMAKSAPMDHVEAGSTLMGVPAVPRRDYFRQTAHIRRLPDMASDLKALKKQVAELQSQLQQQQPEG